MVRWSANTADEGPFEISPNFIKFRTLHYGVRTCGAELDTYWSGVLAYIKTHTRAALQLACK